MINKTENYLEEALCLYFDNVQIVSFKKFDAIQNESFLIELGDKKVVVRFYGEEHTSMGKRSTDDINDELFMIDFYNKKSLNVPTIIESKEGNKYETIRINERTVPFIITKYINGAHKKCHTKESIADSAIMMAKMHKLMIEEAPTIQRKYPGDAISRSLSEIRNLASNYIVPNASKESDEYIKKLLKDFVNKIESIDIGKLPHGPIHGDMKLKNILYKEDGTMWLLDFDNTRNSCFIEDIVNTIIYSYEENELPLGKDSLIKHFISEYDRVRPLSIEEKDALPYFLLSRFMYRFAAYINKPDSHHGDYVGDVNKYIETFKENRSYFENIFE